jgi:putative chitinase
MSNLLGESFEPWVTKQIDVRQKSLGKYSTTQIQSNLVKTPWIRLASSVDLEFDFESGGGGLKNYVPKKLIDSGLDVSNFDGYELAQKSILYGGVISANGTDSGNGGLSINNSITQNSSINNGKSPFNGAYGWGGIDERGYVPMPCITDVSVQAQDRGALTKTTINIKCFSKRQFQIIDVLYLRPGYTLLLEFGHSTYLNSDDEQYVSFENFSSQPLRTLFNPGEKTQYDIYQEIAATRKEHDGNYEAVYGKITTFNWKFNPDGSYDCQVTLTGMGDVIESLKMNISVEEDDVVDDDNGNGEDKDDDDDGEKDDPPLIANKDKSVLNNQLYKIFQTLKSKNKKNTWFDYKLSGYPNPNNEFKKEILKLKSSIFSVTDVDTDGWGSDNQGVQTYITFGALIAIIQTKILLYDNRDGDISIPLFRFDMEFDDLAKDDNYILKIPGTFSADPRICLIPYSNVNPPIPPLKRLIVTDLNTAVKTNSYWNVEDELYVGRLAGILVNINHIAKVLDTSPLDEENNLNLIDFLKSLIRDITQTLGGINKITITTEDGLIRFIEEIPQRLKKIENIEEKKYARFNAFGVKPGVEGSFLTSIDLHAETSNNLSSMIIIGSQVNGNQLSGNAVSFSNYNAGLKDRIIPEKTLSTNSKVDTNTTSSADEDSIIKNFNKIASPNKTDYFQTMYGDLNWFDKNIDTLTNLNTTHASLILGKLTQPDKDNNQQLQAPFFLPFNFSLEMEGLSGMKLRQKFKISEEILPPSYEKGGVDIQIKGINHTVNNSGWKTKLETQSTPAAKLSPIVTSHPLNTSDGGGGSSSTNTGSPGKPPPPELLKAMKDYGITSVLERAHFLAQVAHESGNYFYKEEIASGKAYEGREDLGNTVAGDGVKFKGRGYIQLTGRFNYQKYQNSLAKKGIKDDIISNPTLVATKYAADSAAYWWKNIGRGGNGAMTRLALAGSTSDNVINVTKGVNGGTNGIDDRQTKFDYYWKELIQNPNAFT